MPIYKVKGVTKDGKQKYKVRINYISDGGEERQLTRIAYGNEAAKELEQRLLKDELRKKAGMSTRKMTVQQLFDEFMSVKKYELRETTFKQYKLDFGYHIAPKLKDVRIDRITAGVLRDWKLSIEEKGLALATKQHAFAIFRAMLNYAVRMDYLTKNPLIKIGNFKGGLGMAMKEMSFYTPEEFKLFVSAGKSIATEKQTMHDDLSEWDYYVFFNIAFYTGLRKGEIYALKWSDLTASHLSVKRSVSQSLQGEDRETLPKNRTSIRTLQMPLPLIQVLEEHKRRQRQLRDFNEGKRICGYNRCLRNTSLQKKSVKYASAAGVKVIRIHDFRHSHVSVLANEGINIQEIARRLGHAKIEMTWNTYSHLYPREEEKAVEVLNKMV